MTKLCRLAITLTLLSLVVALVGCSSDKAKVKTAPAPEATPTAVPETTSPDSMTEELVPEPTAGSVVSEEVAEELPDDIVLLNSRGYLSDAFFDTDSYELDDEARDVLARNAAWLQEYGSVKILVEGHCDERNTREYNLALGERRASTVRDYLVFLGISPERIRTVSYGEEKPFALGHDESAWRLNRRAHLVITSR